MLSYTIEDFAAATVAVVEGEGEVANINSIAIDSRAAVLGRNSVFFAIKGDLHDGHVYIADAHLKQCRCFVVEEIPDSAKSYKKDSIFFVVKNSLGALQSFAKHYKDTFLLETISVTGSNGKTIVKEWLHFMISKNECVFRSPKSYNSQVGVPLSILMLKDVYGSAIFEAGMSLPGEMKRLEQMIVPDVGIFTNIGNAHQVNFATVDEKLNEKLDLFENTSLIIYSSNQVTVENSIKKRFGSAKKLFSWGNKETDDLKVSFLKKAQTTEIEYQCCDCSGVVSIPYINDAACLNAATVLAFLFATNRFISGKEVFEKQFTLLPAIEMRLEQVQAINGCSLINDAFNADVESVKIALSFLSQQSSYKKKSLIVSDLDQSFFDVDHKLDDMVDAIIEAGVDRVFAVGDVLTAKLKDCGVEINAFSSTDDFVEKFDPLWFDNEAILLKGSRSFRFEKIASLLMSKVHRTVLEIHLPALRNNLAYFRKQLQQSTKVMVMVKAFSYGSGSSEIAHFLEHLKVDYLAVAFVDEGIELRKSGINLPIMVLSPSEQEYPLLLNYNLEPEIYSYESLYSFDSFIVNQQLSSPYPVHLKFDTGMHRVGFSQDEVGDVCDFFATNISLKPVSVFTHLAGADSEEFDDYTIEQLELFKQISSAVESSLGCTVLKHALNSAGIERFHHYQFDMVRLGIGLYGISAVNSPDLKHISVLKTRITQIKKLSKGQTVGYSRKGKLVADSEIATVPVGYADGYFRYFSNGKGAMIVNGKKASVVGNVCMDATMIDVTGMDAKVGDEVIVFGDQISVSDLADRIGTIPYEILTSISSRVKRIYVNE